MRSSPQPAISLYIRSDVPLWGPTTITDDARNQVPATWFNWNNWRSFGSREAGDAARLELTGRLWPDFSSMMREPLTRKNLPRVSLMLLPTAAFVACAFVLPTFLPTSVSIPVMMLVMSLFGTFYFRWFVSRELRIHQGQAIATALAEGCCAACLYGLRDLDRSRGQTVCPECGATWNTERIGELRGALSLDTAIAAEEARASRSTFERAPSGLASWFFGNKWMMAPTVVDARSRRVRLVDGRVFAQPNPMTRLSEVQLLRARKAMAAGRVRALVLTIFLTTVWSMVVWVQLRMLLRGGPGIGLTGLWMTIANLFVVISIPLAFVALIRQYYPRIRGWKPSPPQPAADALAQLSICACCGEPLTAQPEEDGATVCGSCGASWKTGPQASKP